MTYEDTSTTLSGRTLATKALDLAIGVDFVILQNRHLDLLTLVFNLLGGLKSKVDSQIIRRKTRPAYVVGLLLALLSTTTETKDEMKGGLLLNVVVA